ncbi:MAG: hypothetical protein Q7S44_04070 [bacterium]|nr:hypothetical protein [bacterium]
MKKLQHKYQIKNKSSHYEIDQSGKIEQTERQTVIACTNGTQITILLKKGEKRKIQKVALRKEKATIITSANEVLKILFGTKKSGLDRLTQE